METQPQNHRFSSSLPLRIDRLHLDANRSLCVVRDDLLPAGTKQRAVVPLLQELQRQGITRVIYASPFAGFAQVALAYGCHAVGIACTLFCERDPAEPGFHAHAFTELARGWGAEVILAENLAEAERKAEKRARRGGFKIPLGFHCRAFQRHFQVVVAEALTEIRRQLGFLPGRVWLPVGSGTLTQAFRRSAPASLELLCVDVHVLPATDLRLQALRALPNVRYFSAGQAFHERATELPPVPSNLHYDAKLWALLEQEAEDGDLWWNVAR